MARHRAAIRVPVRHSGAARHPECPSFGVPVIQCRPAARCRPIFRVPGHHPGCCRVIDGQATAPAARYGAPARSPSRPGDGGSRGPEAALSLPDSGRAPPGPAPWPGPSLADAVTPGCLRGASCGRDSGPGGSESQTGYRMAHIAGAGFVAVLRLKISASAGTRRRCATPSSDRMSITAPAANAVIAPISMICPICQNA